MHSMAWLSVLRQLRSLRLDYEQEDAVQMCAVFPPGVCALQAGRPPGACAC